MAADREDAGARPLAEAAEETAAAEHAADAEVARIERVAGATDDVVTRIIDAVQATATGLPSAALTGETAGLTGRPATLT